MQRTRLGQRGFLTPKIRLRRARQTDEDFLRDIRNENRQYFLNQKFIGKQQHKTWFQYAWESTDDMIFIIELLGRRIGTISLYNINGRKKSAELGRFIIKVEYRRYRLGRQAVEWILRKAKALMLQKVYLSIVPGNVEAYHLYSEKGFSFIAAGPGKITMEKDLTTPKAD